MLKMLKRLPSSKPRKIKKRLKLRLRLLPSSRNNKRMKRKPSKLKQMRKRHRLQKRKSQRTNQLQTMRSLSKSPVTPATTLRTCRPPLAMTKVLVPKTAMPRRPSNQPRRTRTRRRIRESSESLGFGGRPALLLSRKGYFDMMQINKP